MVCSFILRLLPNGIWDGTVVTIIHSKLLAVIWTIIYLWSRFYTMVDRYTELTGNPHASSFAMGLHVGTYSGGTWKNEEMTSDKYPPALCKRLREEGVPLICFG